MPHAESRATLKAAVKEYEKHTAQVASLEAAADRAEKAIDQARAELAQHAGLEKEITSWRVKQVKKGLSTKALPENLRIKQDARRHAEEELGQAENTLEALTDELDELRRDVAPLEEKRVKAAVSVLFTEEGNALAEEYTTVAARLHELSMLIHGLGHLRIKKGALIEKINYAPPMAEAIEGAGVEFPRGTQPYYDQGDRWKSRLEALLTDPDASITRPKMIVPADYTRTNVDSVLGITLPPEYKVQPEI